MLEFLFDHRAYLQHALFFVVTIYAWWRGGGPEKWAATTFIASIFAFYTYRWVMPNSSLIFRDVNLGYFAIDALLLASILPLAIVANRTYPLWLLAAQFIATMIHLHRQLATNIEPIVYYILIIAPSYIQITALIAGLVAHRRRVRKWGPYRSWSTSSIRFAGPWQGVTRNN